MTGVLAVLAGGGGASGAALSVVANDVTKVERGSGSSGTVTSVQLPNTQAQGGVSPYDFSWARVSGSLELTPDSPFIQNPTWSAIVSESSEEAAVWRVTVTDDLETTATAEITITLIWLNFG